ncbi:MAG: nicotinamide riboside transporter PnuC [Stenotrophomonas koreensis]
MSLAFVGEIFDNPAFQLELAANLTVAASILLAGRNNIHTWWLGMVGCSLFGLLFHRNQLYADVVLQLFFIVISGFGWWQWRRGDHGAPLPITRLDRRLLWALPPLALLGSLGYGAMLHRLTDAWLPYVDSAVLVFSVVAQLLMMRRKLESWAFWLLVNTIAVPLYASRGLHLTAMLYAVFWINAWVALWHWRRLMQADARPAVAGGGGG